MVPEQTETRVDRWTVTVAWRLTQALDASHEGEVRELTHEARRVIAQHSHEEVARGVIMLIDSLLLTVEPNSVDEVGEDTVAVAVKGFIVKLRETFPEIEPDTLPTLIAIVSAALTGGNAMRWREQVGPPQQPDTVELVYLLWLVRDFLDTLHDSPGATDRLVDAVLNENP